MTQMLVKWRWWHELRLRGTKKAKKAKTVGRDHLQVKEQLIIIVWPLYRFLKDWFQKAWDIMEKSYGPIWGCFFSLFFGLFGYSRPEVFNPCSWGPTVLQSLFPTGFSTPACVFSSTLEKLDLLLQVCLIRVVAKLCRTVGQDLC